MSLHLNDGSQCQSKCFYRCYAELFCLVLYHNRSSELSCKYEKCWFGPLGSLFRRWICSTLQWKWIEYLDCMESHATLAALHCKLENHLMFYFYLPLIVYLLYSIKGTAFHWFLVCFYLVWFYYYCMSATVLDWSTIRLNAPQLLYQTDVGGAILAGIWTQCWKLCYLNVGLFLFGRYFVSCSDQMQWLYHWRKTKINVQLRLCFPTSSFWKLWKIL